MSVCCSPSHGQPPAPTCDAVPGPATDQAIGSPVEVTKKMAAIPGGTHWLGNDSGEAFAERR